MEFKCANCLQAHEHPKLLNCFHVFCDSCLSKRIETNHHGFRYLSCPICHLTTSLRTKEVSDLPTVDAKYCQEHKSQELDVYCKQCERAICSQCATGSHRNHAHASVAIVFPEHKKEIEGKIMPLNNMLLSVRKALAELKSRASLFSSNEKAVEAAIETTTGLVGEALQKRRKRLCHQLHSAAQEKLDTLSSQKNDLTLLQAHLSGCLGFIRGSFRSSSQEEVVRMKQTLMKQVEMLLNEKQVLSALTSPREVLRLEASPHLLIETCQEFGKIFSDSTSPLSSVVASTPSPVSVDLCRLLMQRMSGPLLTLADLKGPCGVTVGSDGEVIVAEGCADRVSVFSPAGKKLRSFGQCGSGPGELTCPCEVSVDQQGNILVVDGSNRRLQKFTREGQLLGAAGGSGRGALQFTEPDGLSVHPLSGKVYVVDNNTHRIQILNPDLTFCKVFGREGDGQGSFRYPWGVWCCHAGEVYVTDSGNCCVQVFTADGQFLRQFGRKGSAPGEFKWPTGISVNRDSSIVYVSDYGNHRVSMFTSEGQFLKSIGQQGQRHGEFGNVRGVVVDKHGLLYVCDTDNNRVVVY